MEIFDHDKENLNELLHVIAELAQYHAENSKDNDDKSFQQPIFFNKPKNLIKWNNPGLNGNLKFDIIDIGDLERDRGLFDTDMIWYNNYILAHGHSLLLHDLLDWQLIAISNGDITPENKIYINVNKDSEMYGFYVYAPGGYNKELFNYVILATSHDQFAVVWEMLKILFDKISEMPDQKKKLKYDGRDIPLKLISKLVKKKPCLLDDYYTCSEKECIKKKKEICKLLEIPTSDILLTVKECGVCYWVRVENASHKIIVGGDLFYDRLQDKFVTRGKNDKFSKWEDSFEKITKALKIEF